MLPITIGVIGAKNNNSRFQAFILSIIYVLGIALTYSVLGVFAALTGTLFGSLLQNPFVIGSIALLFVLMGLSMFDVFSVQVPVSVQTRLSKIYSGQDKNNYLGIGLMGLISGLIATPCVGPIIVSLLTFVAQTGSIFLGFWLLFTFAIGMGILLVVLGTFSNILINMPKAGSWMDTVKKGIGIGLFAVAFYYLKPVLPVYLFAVLLGAFMVLLGTMTGAFIKLEQESGFTKKLQKSAGILVVATGLYFFIGGMASKGLLLEPSAFSNQTMAATAENEKEALKLHWVDSEEKGRQIAYNENKFVMIDFYADWCPACIEFDKYTYTDQKVIEELQEFVPVKIDATDITPEIEKLFKKYDVIGLPAIIFLDKEGKVLDDFTITGYKNPEEFIKIITEIKNIQMAGLADSKS